MRRYTGSHQSSRLYQALTMLRGRCPPEAGCVGQVARSSLLSVSPVSSSPRWNHSRPSTGCTKTAGNSVRPWAKISSMWSEKACPQRSKSLRVISSLLVPKSATFLIPGFPHRPTSGARSRQPHASTRQPARPVPATMGLLLVPRRCGVAQQPAPPSCVSQLLQWKDEVAS